jgi:hypothetical protein
VEPLRGLRPQQSKWLSRYIQDEGRVTGTRKNRAASGVTGDLLFAGRNGYQERKKAHASVNMLAAEIWSASVNPGE